MRGCASGVRCAAQRLQQLPDRNGRTCMMPGRIIPEMAASRSIPYRRLCQNQRVPTSDAMRPLSADGLFQCRDTLRTTLMNDAAKLPDPPTEPTTEEHSVGKECFSTWRCRVSPGH